MTYYVDENRFVLTMKQKNKKVGLGGEKKMFEAI